MVSTMGMEMSERHKSTRFDFYVAVFLILSFFLGLTREGIQSRKKLVKKALIYPARNNMLTP